MGGCIYFVSLSVAIVGVCVCGYTDLELPKQNALASSVVVDCTSELPRITRLLPISPLLKRQRKERVYTPLFIRAVVNSDTPFVGVTAGGA